MRVLRTALALSLCGSMTGIAQGRGAFATVNAGCELRGVWELVSMTIDGKDVAPAGFTQRKQLSDRHFMWLGQMARRDTLPPAARGDTFGGGGGTYTITGSTYVEHIDFSDDPSKVGTSFTATCRVDGGRWYSSFTVPNDTTKGPYRRWIQVYRRVE